MFEFVKESVASLEEKLEKLNQQVATRGEAVGEPGDDGAAAVGRRRGVTGVAMPHSGGGELRRRAQIAAEKLERIQSAKRVQSAFRGAAVRRQLELQTRAAQ